MRHFTALLCTLVLVFGAGRGLAQDCEAPIAGEDIQKIRQEAALRSIVKIKTQFTLRAGTEPSAGYGVVVSEQPMGVGEAACQFFDVWILTAKHVVFKDDQMRADVEVQFHGMSDWVKADVLTLTTDRVLPANEYDVAMLHTKATGRFVGIGFRDARTLKANEMTHHPTAEQSGAIRFEDLKFKTLELVPSIRISLNGSVDAGDSGGPVFDDQWQIVGLMTTKDTGAQGLATPTETLLLASEGYAVNLNLISPDEVRTRNAIATADANRQEIKDKLNDTYGSARLGLFRLSKNVPKAIGLPAIGVKIGVNFEAPFETIGTLGGFEVYLGVDGAIGRQPNYRGEPLYRGYFEVGSHVGLAIFAGQDKNFSVGFAWSPSWLLFQDEDVEALWVLASYSVEAHFRQIQIGDHFFGIGAEMKPLFPFGHHASFVDSTLFVDWKI